MLRMKPDFLRQSPESLGFSLVSSVIPRTALNACDDIGSIFRLKWV